MNEEGLYYRFKQMLRKKMFMEHLRTLSSVYIRKSSQNSQYFYQTATVVL